MKSQKKFITDGTTRDYAVNHKFIPKNIKV